MAFRGKKKSHRGAAYHGRGGFQNATTSSGGSSPAKVPQKKSPSKNMATKKGPRPSEKRSGKDKFGVGDTMVTAQRMVDNQRQTENYLSQVEYCSTPPTTENLVQMRFVIPGDHLAPKALRDPDILDDIRREHKVWITREDGSETLFDISALGTKSLKSALGAINERIHDMRLAEESLAAHFFVQPLREEQDGLKIRFEVGKRPTIEGKKDVPNCNAHAIADLSGQFAAVLPSAFKTLVALSSLKMQVNFGHLHILAKRKNVANLLSAEELKSSLDLYSSRGRGATIQTEFANIGIANAFLSSITESKAIKRNGAETTLHHHVEFLVDKHLVSADLLEADGTTKAAASRCTEVQAHPAIDWIISVPDACVDWNLRVDSRPSFIGERSGKLPEEIAKFVRSFVFSTGDQPAEIDGSTRLFRLPKWQMSNRGELAQSLSNFEIKSCARTQYRDTPYEIEITVTQHWARLPTRAEPDRLSWSVSVSGIHWEEALSEYNTGEALNGPEEGLFPMWPGEGSLEKRLREFLVCIFAVQTAAAAFMAEEGEGTCTRGGPSMNAIPFYT